MTDKTREALIQDMINTLTAERDQMQYWLDVENSCTTISSTPFYVVSMDGSMRAGRLAGTNDQWGWDIRPDVTPSMWSRKGAETLAKMLDGKVMVRKEFYAQRVEALNELIAMTPGMFGA